MSPENGELGTVILLINTMIGAGILNQPYVFSKAGILGACVLYVLALGTVWLGANLVVQAGRKVDQMDLSAVGGYCYGILGCGLTDFMIAVATFGGLLAYMVVISGEVVDMLSDIPNSEDQWWTNISILLPVIVLLFCVPTCLTRHFGHLVLVSTISVFSICCVMALVIVYGPIAGREYQHERILIFSLTGMLTECGSVVFAVTYITGSFFAFNSLELKNQARWPIVSAKASCMGTFMCFITGLSGYLSFRSATNGEILLNFSGGWAYFTKTLLVAHLLLYIPIDFVVMRHSLVKLFNKEAEKLHTAPFIVLSVMLLAVTTALVVFLYSKGLAEGELFSSVISLTGGVALAFVSFVLPGAVFLKVFAKEIKLYQTWYWMSAGLLCWGITVMIIVPYYVFND